MNAHTNSQKFGLIMGLVLPIIAIFIFALYNIDRFGSLIGVFNFLRNSSILSKVVSLCVIPNLLIFFIFMSKKSYQSCKGVISATILYAFLIVILLFI